MSRRAFPPPPAQPLTLDELAALALGGDSERGALRRLYFSPTGRIPRSKYWLHGVLSMLLLDMLGTALAEIAGYDAAAASWAAGIALIWPLLAISAKRLHDFDWSGWWVVLHFTGIGSLAMIAVLGSVPGTRGSNRFGRDPLGRPAPPALSSAH